DVPGFGLTSGKEIPYNSKSYTQFLHKFFKRLKIEKPIIIGNSLGGHIAWNYALEKPNNTKKLVLLSPAAYPLDPPLVVRISNNGFLKWLAKNFSSRLTSDYIARGVFYNRDKMDDYDLERFYDLFNLEGNFDKYMRVFENIMKLKDHTPDLTKLKTPTLLIWGEEDSWIPFKQSKLWKRDVSNLTFIPLDKVGHTPQLEVPQSTIKSILNYIK
ncbi:alpha/beta fold hydrolase, partial [Halobacteriovorax sp.]|uniref:alpha/beta fold hydrolase n=1 Tax=Halobacteriovorax sp. TaxID=2020862 RepID=UPI003565479B